MNKQKMVISALGWGDEIKTLVESPVHTLVNGKRVRYPFLIMKVSNTRKGLRQAEKSLIKGIKEWAKAVRKYNVFNLTKGDTNE